MISENSQKGTKTPERHCKKKKNSNAGASNYHTYLLSQKKQDQADHEIYLSKHLSNCTPVHSYQQRLEFEIEELKIAHRKEKKEFNQLINELNAKLSE